MGVKSILTDSSHSKFKSPIPPHLSPDEQKIWEKDLEWEQQELQRRKNEGFWKYPPEN
tara:strand:- start:577 stop:750 length:174 start_codon:yes stop_codon:yes gene_type:complete